MALTVREPRSNFNKSELPPAPATMITPCARSPPPYFFEDGLRRVQPYHFTYNTNVKQRWRGRGILDIFRDEFRDRPESYYRTAMETGAITVNGKPIESVENTVKNGDIISHTLHRHEPPVTAQPIGIVHEDDDMIVIDKPAGVPVHPAGRYNYNSIVEIMRADRGLGWNPLPCNRLDRLTSGVMFIGKHKKAAEAMTEQLIARTVRKEYVARVVGKFPEGDVVCEQPILQISPKLGLNRVRASGKTAKTVFRRLAYYPASEHAKTLSGRAKEGYSIVRCRPLTGRTHQLRVHLQYLGHPISNDPIYCNARVFGIDLGKGCETADDDDDVMTRLSRMGKEEVAEAVAYHDEMVDEYNRKKAEKMTGELCEICQTPLYSDPGSHELGIYLHALKYASADGSWAYETSLPQWALPPPGYDGPTEATAESDTLAIDLEKLGLQNDEDARSLSLKQRQVHDWSCHSSCRRSAAIPLSTAKGGILLRSSPSDGAPVIEAVIAVPYHDAARPLASGRDGTAGLRNVILDETSAHVDTADSRPGECVKPDQRRSNGRCRRDI